MKNGSYTKRKYVLYVSIILSLIGIAFIINNYLRPKNNNVRKSLSIEDKNIDYIKTQLAVLNNTSSEAKVISKMDIENKQIALVFEGMGNSKTMDDILQLLKQYNMKATFFLPGIRVAEEPSIASNIVKAGQGIGNNTLSQKKNLENASEEDLIKEFYRANNIIKEKTGVKANLLRCAGSKYSEKLCRVAKASGLDYIIDTNIVFHKQFSSEKEGAEFAKATKRGSIVSISIDEKQDTVKVVQNILDTYIKEGFSFMDMDTIISAEKNYEAEIMEMKNNQGIHDDVFSFAHTSAPYVTLTIDGIGSREYTENLLNQLDNNKIKATFFLTGYEILDNLDLVNEIKNRGHEIQNRGLSGADLAKLNYSQAQMEIFRSDKILKEQLNMKGKFLKPVFGNSNDTISKAANDLGYVVATYSKRPQSKKVETASQIAEYFKKGVKRGDIISLKLDNNMEVVNSIPQIAQMVNSIGYSFVTLDTLYNSQYSNTTLKNIPGWNDVAINKSFDSNADASPQRIKKINVSDKTVFLTFDDWGSDKTITTILNLLSKYDVKASFFLIGSGVEKNPNLAKAISDAGHDIGNHTYSHKVVTDLSSDELQAEVVNCYQNLTYATKRKPDLIFRSPTLEMDNASANAILGTGYKYIVSSEIIPRDFDVKVPADEIVKEVMTNTKPGDIISLHLTDHATAIQALPRIIEGLKAEGYKFAKLTDYLK